MTKYKTFINIYRESTGMWTASFFSKGKETATLGGSYPKSNYVEHDSVKRWGREAEIVLTYSKLSPAWKSKADEDDRG